MKQSPLQLEHYELESFHIELVDGYKAELDTKYPSFSKADFGSTVEFAPMDPVEETSNSLWGIKLRLKGGPEGDGNSFPYKFDVAIVGILNGKSLDADKRQSLVLVNGTSLLYGVLRDEVLRLTSRMRNGPLMLPTAQFHHLSNPQSPEPIDAGGSKAALPNKRSAKDKAA